VLICLVGLFRMISEYNQMAKEKDLLALSDKLLTFKDSIDAALEQQRQEMRQIAAEAKEALDQASLATQSITGMSLIWCDDHDIYDILTETTCIYIGKCDQLNFYYDTLHALNLENNPDRWVTCYDILHTISNINFSIFIYLSIFLKFYYYYYY